MTSVSEPPVKSYGVALPPTVPVSIDDLAALEETPGKKSHKKKKKKKKKDKKEGMYIYV